MGFLLPVQPRRLGVDHDAVGREGGLLGQRRVELARAGRLEVVDAVVVEVHAVLDHGELAEVPRHLGRDGAVPLVSDGPALVGSGYVPGKPAVDLCCGDGYFTAPMTHLSSPSKVYALDLDAGLIDRARLHVAEGGEGVFVVFAADDAMRLPSHVPESASFVLLANTFHGVPDKTGLARRVRSVLAPGGFAVVNWCPVPREETRVRGEPRVPATGSWWRLEGSVWRRWRTFLPTTTERSLSGTVRKLAPAELRKTPSHAVG